ncbi:DUF2231 domain-containing protein [Microlunatus antarcticus]|uniref:DUF2231 domain-containing protein n=1 Tax=Microlunatus antarcticus TaxID=53388 RepID=A0A7W5JY87_9ACTN|nr:DUF2231 domain-containing protein [Microlunatus antarcticus]MBB3328542.1 hypothetical protein [Microlunatus antarcticus]
MTVFGLPLHPLIVHATVVVVPTAAFAVLLATFWPRFRRWASWGPAAAAALAVVLVPITTSSGESLEHTLPHSDLIEKHSHLADGLLPWVIALLVGALLVLWPQLAATRPRMWSLPRWLAVAGAVVATAAAVGALVEVVLIGHSGAAAAWSPNA